MINDPFQNSIHFSLLFTKISDNMAECGMATSGKYYICIRWVTIAKDRIS